MSSDDVDPAIKFLRFLGWLLGLGMVANYALAMTAFGDAPTYLVWLGLPLLGWLGFTSPLGRRWFS